MTPSRPNRPTTCLVCYSPMRQPANGRPRRTCSDVCRQRLRRPPSEDAESKRLRREADRIIKIWDRRFGPFKGPKIPGAMTERERLLLYLRSGWEIRMCRFCGRPYIPGGGGSDMFYCSRKCSKAEYALQDRLDAMHKAGNSVDAGTERLLRRSRECPHCGTLFLPKTYRQKYHSDACRVAAHRARMAKVPNCVECGNKIIGRPIRGGPKYCSISCGKEAERRQKRASYAEKHPRRVILCAGCGIEFTASNHASGKTRYCSRKCRVRAANPGRRKHIVLTCRRCGVTFTPANPYTSKQNYCDPCRAIPVKRTRTNDLTYRRRLREERERGAA